MRLSHEEWNKRLEEVKLASEDCKTIAEIIQITDYNREVIKTLFKKFPEEANKIKDNLDKNKEMRVKKKREPDNKKRLSKILEASETCKSFAEISRVTGFSDFIIKNVLVKFPNDEKQVREKVEENKKAKTSKEEKPKKISKKKGEKTIKNVIMLDTSVCRVSNIFNILEEYIQQQNMLGISDLTLQELAGIKKCSGTIGKNARDMINIVKSNLEFFKYFRIREKIREKETIDQAIIEACIPEENITLITADKEMYIQATLQGVDTKYLADEENKWDYKFDSKPKRHCPNSKNMIKVYGTSLENGNLVYEDLEKENQFVKVFSRMGNEKQGKKIYLEKGDHIFIFTKREEYSTFVDYQVYEKTIEQMDMRYNRRLYDCDYDILISINIPEYKDFILQAQKALIES